MKTIFERGTEFAKYHSDVDTIFMRNCYVQGATQQLEIDIQCVCEWLKANRYTYDQTSDNQFSDMLQQLTKAIKGGQL